jgi:xylulokinase
VTAPRHERFVPPVDLGTGGPKVGVVSLTGTVFWSDHLPLATRLLIG